MSQVLVVGSVALDSVETPRGTHEDLLGGSATHFSFSACNFSEVRLVGVVGKDFPGEHVEALKKKNVDTEGLDCEILADQDWSSREWCELGPMVLLFEWKHCTPSAHANAVRSLEGSRCPGREPYRVVMEDHENAIFTRVERQYWGNDV